MGRQHSSRISSGSASSVKFAGPWALHRLINAGNLKQTGTKTLVRFVVGGRDVVYQLMLDTIDNPFILIQQLKFSCPTGL